MSELQNLLHWVHKNAFLRQELQVKPSKLGGLGVFVPDLSVLDEDPLLMRIPKANVLSVKNSGIYNLLVDYSFDEVDISQGIFGLVLVTIYELSFGNSSPWYSYLTTFDFQQSFIPPFHWNQQDKLNLTNTDFDKLGLLNDSEFNQFFDECVQFARVNQSIVPIPPVLQNDDLCLMGKIFTSVTCRAFVIDNFYQLSLVPFADLFNHLSPVVINGKLSNQENVHFVCDGQVCDACGEQGCDHEDDEGEEEDDVDDVDEVEDMEENGVETLNGKIEELDSDGGNNSSDEEVEGAEAGNEDISDDSDDSDDASDGDDPNSDVTEPLEEISEITMEYIAKMEQEMDASDSDSDSNSDSDSDSDTNTLVESDEESTIEESDIIPQTEIESIDDDLAQDLADASKCCDVVMVKVPSKEYNYEIFNTYGNELSNLELLQKYGFIVDNNPNDCISLVNYFTQSFINSKLTKEKAKQLLLRIEWFEEEGFEMINEIVQQQHDHSHEPQQETESSHDCCSDMELPESWQNGVKINLDGTLSIYANCLENLIRLNHKIFKHKILLVKPKRRIANIKQLLTIPCQETYINNMCKLRIANYQPIQPSDNSKVIAKIVQQEQDILSRFIQRNNQR